MDEQLEKIDKRLDKIEESLSKIDMRLACLEVRVEERTLKVMYIEGKYDKLYIK